jgi:hypothetical protein
MDTFIRFVVSRLHTELLSYDHFPALDHGLVIPVTGTLCGRQDGTAEMTLKGLAWSWRMHISPSSAL